MHFGRAIRYHRERSGLSQEALAHAVGLDQSYISKVECGIKLPTIATYAALADVLGVTLDELAKDGNALADTQEVPHGYTV